ncbi:dihydrolipoamide acetyltransferase family protein [Candidatus Phytoplasma phoenicium]|uniref:Dihydrolipoamide acetyltransferase component of pyruvate dehydrogenase complex n=1 Tax=Candidatus Phytoplasma phoenicium TaxID=198422 RepID=A0A0L0MJX8_9MOLU|nr:dihydrolipoamide acetyltransferase family protein [Candidatus Phytoplasma phoenicium]KND62673.1 Dihydrolipoamide acetyltransferase component of pyruvate dehydrogenase complex [Candidatus Phytoplasma phoenicium]
MNQNNHEEKLNFKNVSSINTQEDVEIVKISRLRKTIAKKMIISKTLIPDVSLIKEVDVSNLVVLRQNTKNEVLEQRIKLTYMAFIAKAVIMALQKFPLFNASFDDDKDEIIIKKNINLGIAIDTPKGLIVPNIKNAAQYNVIQLAQEIAILSKNTLEQKIKLDQLQKGTFTLSNFGSLDILYGTPVINHPELAILGIGKIVKKPIVKNNEICISDILPLSLSIDHRIIDGADGGRFLHFISNLLTDTTVLEKHIFKTSNDVENT